MSTLFRKARWWYATPPRLPPVYDKHQRAVPRLPIPKLEDTCARFLKAARPLQTEADYKLTEKVVAKFLSGEGPLLQHELKLADEALDEARPHSSYLESMWYRIAYLGCRDSVAINSNPALVLKPPVHPGAKDPLFRAASLLAASASWLSTFRAGGLPLPCAPNGAPLCASMFGTIMGTSRLPEPDCDRIRCTPDAQHAVIWSRGQWFSLPLFSDGRALTAPQLLASLMTLPLQTAADETPPIGAFTCEHRDTWAATRATLVSLSETNRTALEVMDSALMALVLDETQAASLAEISRCMLCGDARARWFDKFTMIVLADGTAGINFEHSPVDGAQAVAFLTHVNKTASQSAPPLLLQLPPPSPSPLLPLRWELGEALAERSVAAARAYQKLQAQLDIEALVLPIGYKWSKSRGVGLDGLFQLAMQIGFSVAAAPELPPSVYEACSTQAYRAGRTEVIRSVTEESVALVARVAPLLAVPQLPGGASEPAAAKAAAAAAATAFERLRAGEVAALHALLGCALASHRNLVQRCQQGQGHERHLRALLDVAQARGDPTPALFADAAWSLSTASVLSTSGLRAPPISLFSFGPVVPHGVGLAYLLENEGITLNVTSWRTGAGGGPAAAAVAQVIHTAVQLLKLLVEASPLPAPRSKL